MSLDFMAPERRERIVPCGKCDGGIPCANCEKTHSSCSPAVKRRSIRFKHMDRSPGLLNIGHNKTHGPTKPNTNPPSVLISSLDRCSHETIVDDLYPQGQNATVHSSQMRSRESSIVEAAVLLQSLTNSLPSQNEETQVSSALEDLDFPKEPNGLSQRGILLDPNSPVFSTPPIQLDYVHNERQLYSSSVIGTSEDDESELQGPYCLPPLILYKPWPQYPLTRSLTGYDNAPEPPARDNTLGFQEACLLQCFVQHLANAFDTTDKHRAYREIVPREARRNPLLLNAICTAAAGYLTILKSARNTEGIITFNGIPLASLSRESTIHYHNACISYMMNYINHQTSRSDDILVAIPILRYHEQVDTNLTGSDSETYTNALKAVLRFEQSNFLTPFSIVNNTHDYSHIKVLEESALRRSACLIALRQEIWGVLCYHRPFRLSLPTQGFIDLNISDKSDYDEYNWTNHIIIWVAYVLKYCFGSENEAGSTEDSRETAVLWESLQAFEKEWETLTPNPLDPFYYQERDPEKGQFFPIIWQSNDCRVIGMQHVELARIVLTVHESKHQFLGLGAAAATRAIEHKLRSSTRIICGLALSHRIQSAMTSASIAVSLCGEHFHNPREQDALLELMGTIEREHAWPTSSIVCSLRTAWAYHLDDSE
ncbi:hypothetical protein GQX73_g9735 [Xylaria multiplex]|uniref:Zn(2)-C6 fungal-type domain-containing protein n=1 Tax=Xylaria multiplex TaxID=323545 RepID=A0A7C8MJC4_9PEZI|nr:hypothetical protein GQX73_g9735 [Xylaria multiplex]